MAAADDIRGGVLAKFQALEEAGLNQHTVEFFIFVSSTGGKEIAGKQGDRLFKKLTLKPNPEVVFNRREIVTQDGLQTISDVQLKGAFPETLDGLEILVNDAGEVTASSQISVSYAGPREFRLDIERTDYILINGERYTFRAGGYLNIDKLESKWSLKLLRTDKQ